MKYTYTFILLLATSFLVAQNVNDIVITGEGYHDQVWYSMENGQIASAPKDNWDLAFEISGFTASIRFNEQKGLTLFSAPYAIGEWSSVDTTGMANNWARLHNDPKSWQGGAFNSFLTSELDLGWGIYNMVTHVISGDSLYVIQLANGDFKKLRIDNLASGTYNFTYANLDGTEESSAQIIKSEFSGKNFGYFNLETNEVIDREPLSEDWDITFTKYIDLVGPNGDTPYGVTGILQNYHAHTAQADDTPTEDAQWYAFTFSEDINTIGYDWKAFDFELGYVITENLSYFVANYSGNIYQIVFTNFEGSASGVYEFSIQQAGTVGITEVDRINLQVYPNPTRGNAVQLTWQTGEFEKISLFDLTGKQVLDMKLTPAENAAILQTNNLTPGVYLLQLSGGLAVATQKLIISN